MSRLIKAFAFAAGLFVSGSVFGAKTDGASIPDQSNQSSSLFDTTEAQRLMPLARLPVDIEHGLRDGKTLSDLHQDIQSDLPLHTEYAVVRHKNSTVLIAYNTDQETITVSFDGGNERADIFDDAKFWKKKHPLGGKVHSGFYSAIMKKNDAGVSLMDAVEEQIDAYVLSSEAQKNLIVTGFSRGGSMAIVAAGKWIADDFAQNDRLRLQTVYTFGNPPAGNKVFTELLNKEAQERNIAITTVISGNDPMPHILTETSPWYMPSSYRHPGSVFYLGTDTNGLFHILKNPDREQVREFRHNAPEMKWHDLNVYEDMLEIHGRVVGHDDKTQKVEKLSPDKKKPVASSHTI